MVLGEITAGRSAVRAVYRTDTVTRPMGSVHIVLVTQGPSVTLFVPGTARDEIVMLPVFVSGLTHLNVTMPNVVNVRPGTQAPLARMSVGKVSGAPNAAFDVRTFARASTVQAVTHKESCPVSVWKGTKVSAVQT